jgi:Ca2+-binding EF-hand superfamily protein
LSSTQCPKYASLASTVELSDQQLAQIREIFDLFDTDGGGSIDSSEMDAAMFALGFQPPPESSSSVRRRRKRTQKQGGAVNGQPASTARLGGISDPLGSMSSLGSVGSLDLQTTVTLDEFTALMKGEMMGRSPLDAIWDAFTALSHEGAVAKSAPTKSAHSSQSGKTCEHTAATAPGCVKEPEEAKGISDDEWGVVTLEGLRLACHRYDVRVSEEELQCLMEETDIDGSGSIDREEFMLIMYHAPWF